MDDLTGHITKGYELHQRIGVGGFGAVYRAFQSSISREVAIKVILPQFANHPDFIRRFETEAQLVARLEHPFIVPLFDYWREPDGAYLVMRYFRGGSLRDMLEERKLSKDEVVQLIDQITSALSVAHRNGVIHRDLKPDNILLDDDGNAFLTDFGIAKEIIEGSGDDEDEGISGSPGYMSPEQIISNPVSPQTDIYALGIMMYELLVGKHPFYQADTTELIYKHLQETLPDINFEDNTLPYELNEVIQQATAKDPEDRYPDTMALAKAFRRAMSEAVVYEDVEDDFDYADITNPYKGLRPFEEADASDFFGREWLIRQLVGRLQETGDFVRFLAVVGPSGSGKSSVVKAGMLPALRWGDVPGSEQWFIAEMVPGTEPIDELTAALLSVASNPSGDILNTLKASDDGLLNAVNTILPQGSEMLLVIDQFEEVFTLLDNEKDRTHFLSLIRTAVSNPDSRIRIIVTLRADFYDRPLLYEGFGTLMRLRTEVVLPLSPEDLERAITGPAERVGLEVEPNLLAAIIADVSEEPGALPLLQYVLTEVFERRSGRTLTQDAYVESGGALGALARRATELYDALDEKYRPITRQIFLRLVTLGEGTEDTRRRVRWAELTSFGIDRDDLQHVLDSFGRYRLLSFDRDPQTREPTIEVAHEALIREWKLLREWLNASREDVRLQRNLSSSADEWLRSKQDNSFLLRGTRLSQFEEWSQTTDIVLSHQEREYLQQSIEQREIQLAAEAERLAREAELERISRNRLRSLAFVLAIGFLVAIALSFFAFNQSQVAQSERDNAQTQVAIAATAASDALSQERIAEREASIARSLALAASARQLESAGDHDLALALALEGNMIESPPDQVQRTLATIAYAPGMIRLLERTEAGGHIAPVSSVSYSPDGTLLLSGSQDGSLILWDAATGELIRSIAAHSLPVADAAFSLDGERVFSASWDSTVSEWDVETGEEIRTFDGHSATVGAISISPDGTRLLSGSLNEVVLWDISSGDILNRYQLDSGQILSLSFSPDGQFAAAGTGDNEILYFNIETGETIFQMRGHTSSVNGIAFSPDGSRLLSGSSDTRLILWNMETGQIIRRFGESSTIRHDLSINSVAFDPGGNVAISGADDNQIILWDVNTGLPLKAFESLAAVNSVAITPDGRKMIVGQDDNRISMWSLDGDMIIDAFLAHSAAVNDVDFHPQQMIGISVGDDSTVTLMDLNTGQMISQLTDHSAPLNTVSFTPDGEGFITGGDDGSLAVWSLADQQITHTIAAHSDAVTSLDISPDGSMIVSSSDDSTIGLWETGTGALIRNLVGHDRRVLTVAFSSSGNHIVSGSADRTVIVWNTQTGESEQIFSGHGSRILSAVFSPDESMVLSTAADGTVILWSVETGAVLRRFTMLTEEATTSVLNIVFDSMGQYALGGVEDGTMVLWDVSTGQPIRVYDLEGTDFVAGISSVAFNPDDSTAITALRNGRVLHWRTPTLVGLIDWTFANRAVPELTCDQRILYGVQDQCETQQ